MVLNAIFNPISVVSLQPVHLSMLSWSYLNQYSAQYSFQATGCFPTTIVKTMGSGERNEACLNDYHQSSERILAEPGIEPATLKGLRVSLELHKGPMNLSTILSDFSTCHKVPQINPLPYNPDF